MELKLSAKDVFDTPYDFIMSDGLNETAPYRTAALVYAVVGVLAAVAPRGGTLHSGVPRCLTHRATIFQHRVPNPHTTVFKSVTPVESKHRS